MLKIGTPSMGKSLAIVLAVLALVSVPAQAQNCERHIYNNSSETIGVMIVKSGQDWQGTIAANTAMTIDYHNDVRGFVLGRMVGGEMEWGAGPWPFTGFTGDLNSTTNFLETTSGRLPGKVGAAFKAGAKLNPFWLAIKAIVNKPSCYWVHDGSSDTEAYGVVFNDPANGDIIVVDMPNAAPSAGVTAADPIVGWDQIPFFGTSTLEAGFSSDPRTVTVSAGGGVLNPLDGPGCVGYIGVLPTHIVDYTAGAHSTLTFSSAPTDPAGDLTLVVRTPSGVYHCDDDSGEGTNPRIDVDSPESGEYRIWAGSFSNVLVENTVLAVSEVGNVAE